jgi:2'-5' RNA ligase
VWPSAPVVAALAALPRPALARLRWSTEDHWHVTLRFFGELTTTQVDDVSAVLAEVARSWADDVTAQGGPATRFLGPGLIVWPVEGLRRLARAVEEATAHIGQPAADRPFFGHLTIARGSRGTDFRAIPHLLSALSGSWPVTSLSLVHSQLSAAGAHYRDLRAFPLGAPRAPSGPS